MTNPEKAQLIHPPITIMGRTFVRFPFIMSVNMLESATHTHTHIQPAQGLPVTHLSVGGFSSFILYFEMFSFDPIFITVNFTVMGRDFCL